MLNVNGGHAPERVSIIGQLTCQHCRNTPACEVVVADLVEGVRIIHLVCTPCADYSVGTLRQSDFLWRYVITPRDLDHPPLEGK